MFTSLDFVRSIKSIKSFKTSFNTHRSYSGLNGSRTFRLDRNLNENALRRILNFRYSIKLSFALDTDEFIMDAFEWDCHTLESWHWTKTQSEYIDKYGWDKWFSNDNRIKGKDFENSREYYPEYPEYPKD